MEIQLHVGQNVRSARLGVGLSQWALVARLELQSDDHGVNQAYISLLETGNWKKEPNSNDALANFHGIGGLPCLFSNGLHRLKTRLNETVVALC